MNEGIKRINSHLIYDNRIMIYNIVLYISGLLIGCALYKTFGSAPFDTLIKKLNSGNGNEFINLFFSRTCVYLTVFLVSMLFGMCIIGYPVICAVPLLTGLIISLKIVYYYANYKLKGIGYSLLLLIPEASLFEVLLIFTLNKSAELSKVIFKGATNKKDMTEELELKSYLKSYLLYFLILLCIAGINSALVFFINKVVTL